MVEASQRSKGPGITVATQLLSRAQLTPQRSPLFPSQEKPKAVQSATRRTWLHVDALEPSGTTDSSDEDGQRAALWRLAREEGGGECVSVPADQSGAERAKAALKFIRETPNQEPVTLVWVLGELSKEKVMLAAVAHMVKAASPGLALLQIELRYTEAYQDLALKWSKYLRKLGARIRCSLLGGKVSKPFWFGEFRDTSGSVLLRGVALRKTNSSEEERGESSDFVAINGRSITVLGAVAKATAASEGHHVAPFPPLVMEPIDENQLGAASTLNKTLETWSHTIQTGRVLVLSFNLSGQVAYAYNEPSSKGKLFVRLLRTPEQIVAIDSLRCSTPEFFDPKLVYQTAGFPNLLPAGEQIFENPIEEALACFEVGTLKPWFPSPSQEEDDTTEWEDPGQMITHVLQRAALRIMQPSTGTGHPAR